MYVVNVTMTFHGRYIVRTRECPKRCSTDLSRNRRLANTDAEFLHDPDALLLIFGPQHPEFIAVFHDLGKHGTAKEHHVLSTWRILDADFEFLNSKRHICLLA